MASRVQDRAFTLIEVLVVVAIIALLIAILLPSLATARERARIIKCLAHQGNMPKAMQIYAADHKGYGPFIGRQYEVDTLADPSHSLHDYQLGMFGTWRTGTMLKPWPVALAKYMGQASVKRAENMFSLTYSADPNYYYQLCGRREIFECPSDKILVTNEWSPVAWDGTDSAHGGGIYGVVSYAANEDVLGVSYGDGTGWCWKGYLNGVLQTGPRLKAKIDKVYRPSEVVMTCDGGLEEAPWNPTLLISADLAHGPYIENYEYTQRRLPHFRHSGKGGIACSLMDGSSKYMKPLRFKTISGVQYVQQYGPRVRISPYNIYSPLPTDQP